MATFRKIHVSFWADPYVEGLTPEQKYFFLYLLTNDKTKQCGIYEITKKQISYDTGYNIDTISILIDRFSIDRKIRYSSLTNEIGIKNWEKYNWSNSPSVQSLVDKELMEVKDKKMIQWIQSVDTVSVIEEEREEKKKEKEKENKKKNTGMQIRSIDYLFPDSFKSKWDEWLEYKKTEHKDRYKVEKTEQLAIKHLFNMAGGDEELAQQIIEQSISNRWKGLFPIKSTSVRQSRNLSRYEQNIETQREKNRNRTSE